MKQLDRYVLKELLVPLFVGTIVFAFLFVGNESIAVYRDFNVDAVPFLAIVQYLIFHFPYWLSLTLPIGTALGASLAISRLARESEITAMRAAGVSVSRVLRPVLLAGLFMSVTNYVVVEQVLPPAMKAWRKLANDIGFIATMPQLNSNVMMSINQYSARFGSVQRGKDGTILLRDVLLIEEPRPGEYTITKAPSGTFRDGTWRVKSAQMFHFKGTSQSTIDTKDELVIYNPIRIADLFMPPQPSEMSAKDLALAISANRAAGQPTTANELALQDKFAGPAACLVFAFAGAVFAIRFSKVGPFVGLMVSLGLVLLNFNLYVISTEIFGKKGWIPPITAAWMPNVLFLILGLFFVRKLE